MEKKKKKIQCKDYAIFMVNTYADKNKSGKIDLDNADVLKQHHDRAEKHIKFCWKLIEKLTGKKMDWWIEEYAGYDVRECALEYIWQHFGIMTSTNRGFMQYMIPKDQTELIKWIKDNLDNPYTMPKKINIRYFNAWCGFPVHKRILALQFKKKYYPDGLFKTLKPALKQK